MSGRVPKIRQQVHRKTFRQPRRAAIAGCKLVKRSQQAVDQDSECDGNHSEIAAEVLRSIAQSSSRADAEYTIGDVI